MGAYIINIPSAVDRIIYVVVESDGKTEIATRSVSSLQPYTEPEPEEVTSDAYQQGYQQGYDEGKLTTEHEAYLKGLYDAWECARKIDHMADETIKEIFGCGFSSVFENLTASKAIEKIRQYEQEKEEIQVGDEVIIRYKKAVVTEITDRFVRIMYSDGSGYALFSKNMTKTGRNFPEIAEVLQKMKES